MNLMVALLLSDLWLLPKRYQNLKPEVEQIVDVVGLRDDCAQVIDVHIDNERSDRNDHIVVITCQSPQHESFRLSFEVRSQRLLKGRGSSLHFTEMFDQRWHQSAWIRCEAKLDVAMMQFSQFSFEPALPKQLTFTAVLEDDRPPKGVLELPFYAVDPAGRRLNYKAICDVDKLLNIELSIVAVK